MKSDQESVLPEIISDFYLKIELDPFSILSYSFIDNEIIGTRDYKIRARIVGSSSICKLLPQVSITNFVEFEIKDDTNRLWYPISGISTGNYSIFLVSEFKGGYKTKIAYFCNKNKSEYPLFLNTGDSNPIALYGCSLCAASIDSDGGIIYIPESFSKHSNKLIVSQHLPEYEKAINLAWSLKSFYALSFSGKLFISKDSKKLKLDFHQVNEFKNIKVIQISGNIFHLLVLTEEGRVFAIGDNLSGQLGIGNKNNVTKFTEIASLNKYNIKNVYAKINQSFFQTEKGKVLACGSNSMNRCLINESENQDFLEPTETKIKKDAMFCVPGDIRSIFLVGFDAEKSPNRQVNNDINITIFGYKIEMYSKIIQIFINNNQNEINNNTKKQNEYKTILEIDKSKINVTLIDSSEFSQEERVNCFQQFPYLLFFFDVTNPESLDGIKLFYQEACVML